MRSLRARLTYFCHGLAGRVGQRRCCPACGARQAELVERKYFHRLFACQRCALLYRYPADSDRALERLYQRQYAEPGLTTQLPAAAELQHLLDTGFAGSEKDCSRSIALLRALEAGQHARVLDFGANWGYAVWQMRRAGFAAEGYELSRQRAAFGAQLGVAIVTSPAALRGDYDIVFSHHVLEHLPDPAAGLRAQLALLKSGGYVVGYTPNGCAAYRRSELGQQRFRQSWGQVHPVLLTAEFVLHQAEGRACLVSSGDVLAEAAHWRGVGTLVGELAGPELVFVIRKEA